MMAHPRSPRADYFRQQAERARSLASAAHSPSNEMVFREIAAQYEELALMVDQGILDPQFSS